MRVLVIILVIVIVLLQYRLWFGDGGIVEIRGLRHAITAQQLQNNGMRERNENLAAEVKDLKQGVDAIEERARSELGMVREGEVFYQTLDDEKAKQP